MPAARALVHRVPFYRVPRRGFTWYSRKACSVSRCALHRNWLARFAPGILQVHAATPTQSPASAMRSPCQRCHCFQRRTLWRAWFFDSNQSDRVWAGGKFSSAGGNQSLFGRRGLTNRRVLQKCAAILRLPSYCDDHACNFVGTI